MAKPQFGEIVDAVNNDVIRVASHYPLITDFFFVVLKQPMVEQHYPWFLPQLFSAVTGDIVLTLGRLFDVRNDARIASLWTFLSGVEPHHAHDADVRPDLQERRIAFTKEAEAWRKEIRTANRRLALRRNADLAHNDLTKVGRSDIKWTEFKDMIALAERILKTYFHAFSETDQRLVVVNVEREILNFLKWARLDDYAKHWKADRDARQAAREDWIRRRQAGDPTVPERPPV